MKDIGTKGGGLNANRRPQERMSDVMYQNWYLNSENLAWLHEGLTNKVLLKPFIHKTEGLLKV